MDVVVLMMDDKKKKREPNCALCLNHGVKVLLKGKYFFFLIVQCDYFLFQIIY